MSTERISDEEFMRRLRARFIEVAGEGADEVADNADIVDWRDGFEDDPEGAADSEMSYWDDDGE
jgi:hypothetical protein